MNSSTTKKKIETSAPVSQVALKNKISNLITKLSGELYEREDAIRLAFLALLAGESIFFLGPPGVAKSLISRQIKSAIVGAEHFEYLMNRFSTPEEIFGPISLKKLDEDKYERKVEGYLPTAHVAFLDEIWKASPSIQNTLLTIINEKLFRNGSNDLNVPLQVLISASNELPAQGEGLEALYDRFLIRVFVDNLSNNDNFLKMVDGAINIKTDIKDSEKLTIKEIVGFREGIQKIAIPKEIGDFILELKKQLKLKLEGRAPYISDRRWKKIVWLLKTSAFVSGRTEINFVDLTLIPNFIWENTEHILEINQLFNELWRTSSVTQFGYSLENIKKALEKYSDALDEVTAHKATKQRNQEPEIVKLRDSGDNLINYMVFRGIQEHPQYQFIAFPVEYVDSIWEPKFPSRKTDNYYIKRVEQDAWTPLQYIAKNFFFAQGNFYYKNTILRPHLIESSQIKKYESSDNKVRDIYVDFIKIDPLIDKIQKKLENMMQGLITTSSPLVGRVQTEVDELDRYLGTELRNIIASKNLVMSKIIASGEVNIKAENEWLSKQRETKLTDNIEKETLYVQPVVEEKIETKEKENLFTNWEVIKMDVDPESSDAGTEVETEVETEKEGEGEN